MTTLDQVISANSQLPQTPIIILQRKKKARQLTGIKRFRLLTPKDMVPRLGTSEAMVRIFLRKYYPEIHVKNKFWNISP